MNENHKVLFEYWKSIPALKFINAPEKIYKAQPIRRAIVRLLREGIDVTMENGEVIKRRILSATELKQLLFERKQIDISQTNLYFHLNILIEAGFIQVGETLLEGPHNRIKTKYFGRVARNLLISDQELSFESYNQQFTEFKKFAKKIGFTLPNDYDSLPKKYHDLKMDRYKKLGYWMIKQEEILEQEQINVSDVYEFLKILDELNPETPKLLGNLAKNFQDLLSVE